MMRGKKTGLILSMACILLVQCSTRSPAPLPDTATPAPEPAVSPVPEPTASSQPSPTWITAPLDAYEMRAWSLFSRTRVDSIQRAFARLTRDGEGVAGAQMYVLVHYGDYTRRYPEQGTQVTDEKGIATVDFPVAEARPEEVVLVDVCVLYDETTYQSVVSFTANC